MRYGVMASALAVLGAASAPRLAAQSDSSRTPPLFRSEAPLEITLTTNVRRLRADRGENSPYHAATISYTGADGKQVTVPMRVKTHGIWRLKHCELPPLRFNIKNADSKHTLFHDLQRPKLINSCRNSDQYERLVLQEMQLYRIYQLLTPNSHKMRALHIAYADSATGSVDVTRYGFLIEDPDKLAERLGGIMVKTKGATPSDIDTDQGALVYVFQYFIANTDFSFNGLHNGELVMRSDGSALTPVAYDFDFSGAVNAPYATVDPRLSVKRVRERLFRGYCAFDAGYAAAFATFRAKKAAIYALYSDDVGKLLDPSVARETLAYFDEFYDDIKDDESARRNVLAGCLR